MTPPTGPLAKKLRHALAEAQAHPLQRQRFTLGRGLTIVVYVYQGLNHLALVRPAPIFPSDQEWHTVLRNWPQPGALDDLEPKRNRTADECYLWADWKPKTPQPFAEATDA